MNEEFKNKIIELSNKIGVKINEKEVQKFYDYMNLLLEWNEKINLTAITEMNDVILKHFVDSMTILKYVEDNKKVVDVGTGAGFPGIPIAIMNDNVDITLLDSLNKRLLFLKEVIDKLNLKNVNTVHGRAEDFGQDKSTREKYDIAVSRAVANMSTLSEYLIPTVKTGGICICMKGAEIEQELEDAKKAIKEFGGKIERIEKFVLPNSDMERNIIIIRKEKQTPNRYPRKAGTPAKEPIK